VVPAGTVNDTLSTAATTGASSEVPSEKFTPGLRWRVN
jgi:hypothetical protein